VEARLTKRSSLLFPPSPGDDGDECIVRNRLESDNVEMISIPHSKNKTRLSFNCDKSTRAANSVRSIELDILYNPRHDDGGGLLGKMVERTCKECVVNASFTQWR
jgi:hypothetical protein